MHHHGAGWRVRETAGSDGLAVGAHVPIPLARLPAIVVALTASVAPVALMAPVTAIAPIVVAPVIIAPIATVVIAAVVIAAVALSVAVRHI